MRFSTTPTSISSPVQARQNGGTVVYRGVTQDAATTELFIDQQAGRRLVPDNRSGGTLFIKATMYNITDNTVLSDARTMLYTTSSAGVIALSDLDSGTGGVQSNVSYGLSGVTTRAGNLNINSTGGNGFLIDSVAASGSTPAYLRLQVTGAASKAVAWEIVVDFVEATAANG